MTVIPMARLRANRAEVAVRQLQSALEMRIPQNIYTDGYDGAALLMDADWKAMEAMFEAFAISVSRDITPERLIDLWYHLVGKLGVPLRIRFSDEALYHTIKRRFDPKVCEYMDALVIGNRVRARALATELDLVNTCPPMPKPGE